MSVEDAIRFANAILPGEPAPENETDPRWQAIIKVGEFIESNPEEVWTFIRQWGSHEQDDLRAAIATCLLEHLLDAHFDLIFPRAEAVAIGDSRFAQTVAQCWILIPKEHPDRLERFNRLLEHCRQIKRD